MVSGYICNIQEMQIELDACERKSGELYKRSDELREKLFKCRCKLALESGLFRKSKWYYVRNPSCLKKGWVTFAIENKDDKWSDEFESLMGGLGYHYKIKIIDGEVVITGNDGEMEIYIKEQFLDKWIQQINPVIDIDDINDDIKRCCDELKSTQRTMDNLMVMRDKFEAFYMLNGVKHES